MGENPKIETLKDRGNYYGKAYYYRRYYRGGLT